MKNKKTNANVTSKNELNKENVNKENELILNNSSNYNETIINSFSDISMGFLNVIFEYVYTIITEMTNIKNKKIFQFIFKRGLETIIHIFSLLFYYTKNIELTMKYSKNALYEYIEFIDQISDDKVTFLNLTSRDAVLFVYKKSISEINNDYRKSMKEPVGEEKYILSILNTYMMICKNVILFVSNYSVFDKPTINECFNCVKTIGDNVNKMKIELIDNINIFAIILNDIKMKDPNSLQVKQYLELLNQFTKTIGKKKINENFKNNIFDLEIVNGKIMNSDETKDVIDFIFL
jgi:hypothetical protein